MLNILIDSIPITFSKINRLLIFPGLLFFQSIYCQTPCLLPSGPLHTAGCQLVDQDNNPVRIASVHYYYNQPSTDMPWIKNAGFNTIRMMWYNLSLTQDLHNIDQAVSEATKVGLKVILDCHANNGTKSPCWAQQANGLWYDTGGASGGDDGCGVNGGTTDARFLEDWQTMALHFKGNTTVIGYDIKNEPLEYGHSTWEEGSSNPDHNIRNMYERVGNAILAIDSTKLIICEGPQNYSNHQPWGNLSLAGQYPVVLSKPNQVVYSVHDYPKYISDYTPFSGLTKIQQMNADWGYLYTQNIAPVWIGEMGGNFDGSWGNEVVSESQSWAQTLLDYMNGKYASSGGPAFSGNQQAVSGDWFACCNLNYGDINGIEDDDGSIRQEQQVFWSQMLYYGIPADIAPGYPSKKIVSLFPIPITEYFELDISPEMVLHQTTFKLIGITGNVLWNITLNNHETTISRGNLKKGIYFYEVFNDNVMISSGKLVAI